MEMLGERPGRSRLVFDVSAGSGQRSEFLSPTVAVGDISQLRQCRRMREAATSTSGPILGPFFGINEEPPAHSTGLLRTLHSDQRSTIGKVVERSPSQEGSHRVAPRGACSLYYRPGMGPILANMVATYQIIVFEKNRRTRASRISA